VNSGDTMQVWYDYSPGLGRQGPLAVDATGGHDRERRIGSDTSSGREAVGNGGCWSGGAISKSGEMVTPRIAKPETTESTQLRPARRRFVR
jgi:hypothetical protein